MSNPETKPLAISKSSPEPKSLGVGKMLGVIFLACLLGVGGTWLYQRRHPVSLVVDPALKNGQDTEDSFSSSARNRLHDLPPLSFPENNVLAEQSKAQDEAVRKIREALRAQGIKTSED